MKRTYHVLLFTITFALLCACASENDSTSDNDNNRDNTTLPMALGRRTIIAYVTADNNLSSTLSDDIAEMVAGSKDMPSDCRLIVFADINGQKPYIAHLQNGELRKIKQYDNDFYTTSADSMRNVLQWIINNFPSEEYAAIIEGHGSGPLIRKDTISTSLIKTYAYGYDAEGENSATSTPKWQNIPSMAAAFNSLKAANGSKIKMAYLFFDCCCFQSVEVAYELRHATEYIIAPVSETPADGANYKHIMSALCSPKDSVAKNIVSQYSQDCNLCISAVKTNGLEDLCKATKRILGSLYNSNSSPLTLDRYKCIYYYRGNETGVIRTPTLHDIKNIIKINASQQAYDEWLPYLEKVVFARQLSKRWDTVMDINFYSFDDCLSYDYYGGLSMIAPTEVYTENGSDINTTMFQLEWCRDVGWKEFGW